MNGNATTLVLKETAGNPAAKGKINGNGNGQDVILAAMAKKTGQLSSLLSDKPSWWTAEHKKALLAERERIRQWPLLEASAHNTMEDRKIMDAIAKSIIGNAPKIEGIILAAPDISKIGMNSHSC